MMCDVSEKFEKILRENGIHDTVSEVIVKDAGLKGEGFASLTQYVTITFQDDRLKPLNLFTKVHTPSASHTAMLTEMKAFEKEGTFLCKYVASAKEMCQRKGYEGFIDFYPKCYYGDDTTIVLENLVLDRGFEMIDKSTLQDLEAAKLALKTLAKHHAVAHVMIQEAGGRDGFFRKFPNLDLEAFEQPNLVQLMEPSFQNTLKSFLRVLDVSAIDGSVRTARMIRDRVEKVMKLQTDCLRKTRSTKLIGLCHGDYWNNNMMFLRDKETNGLRHHIAIDLQITRYNSFGLDLGYYFYTSVQPDTRKTHLHELLKLYLETLKNTCQQFGHPIDVEFDELLQEYKHKAGFGFWTGITMTAGPGLEIYKDLDIGEMDMKDAVHIFDGVFNKWIDENPNERDKFAKELSDLFDEYDEIVVED